MNNKIIIHNYTDLSDSSVLSYISIIIEAGKVSKTSQGEQYSFITRFITGYAVSCDRKGNTYTFKIFKE